MPKLYEIPRDTKLKLTRIYPQGPGEPNRVVDEICDFKHVDGMYSLIITPGGQAVHLSASTEVKLVDDHYEIV